MRTNCKKIIKQLSGKEQQMTSSGNFKLHDRETKGGGTNNGNGAGNISGFCCKVVSKSVSYNRCKQENVNQC